MADKNLMEREWETHVKSWQTTMDEMKLQMALGKADAMDKVEEYKKDFSGQMNVLKRKLDESKTDATEAVNKVRGGIDELQVQLALGKAESKEEYYERKAVLDKLLHEMVVNLENSYGKVDEDLHARIKEFSSRIEAARVQFTLGKYESRDELTAAKKELREKIQDFQQKISSLKKEPEDKWDKAKDELNNSFEHLKGAFSELLS